MTGYIHRDALLFGYPYLSCSVVVVTADSRTCDRGRDILANSIEHIIYLLTYFKVTLTPWTDRAR